MTVRRVASIPTFLALLIGAATDCLADANEASPFSGRLLRVLTLRDYNTRVVLLGTVLLGVGAGVVGVFTLLRRRSLIGDVVGHASLPGIGIAFLVMESVSPGSGRNLAGLLLGAFLAGMAGVACVTFVRTWTRIREDAALAIVLSLFFGLGIALFTVIQNLPGGNAAGINQFIFGKPASLVENDVRVIAIAATVSLLVSIAFLKEFRLLCFDEDFARTQGWPVVGLDLLMMALVGGVTVVGLQSVGLLLVVALLIIPPVSARFWTNRLSYLAVLSGILGGLASALGVIVSALFSRLAAGAVIVLSGTAIFLVSLLLGTEGGIVRRALQAGGMRKRIGQLDFLRACYEGMEARGALGASSLPIAPNSQSTADVTVSQSEILGQRDWTPRTLNRLIRRAAAAGLCSESGGHVRLTERGFAEAARATRNHRLWETYLIAYADIAPSHVDRSADAIEHVLDRDVIKELERMTARRLGENSVPPSPHRLDVVSAEASPPSATP